MTITKLHEYGRWSLDSSSLIPTIVASTHLHAHSYASIGKLSEVVA